MSQSGLPVFNPGITNVGSIINRITGHQQTDVNKLLFVFYLCEIPVKQTKVIHLTKTLHTLKNKVYFSGLFAPKKCLTVC